MLPWQEMYDMEIDLPYLQSDTPAAEYTGFLRQFQARPVIDQGYARVDSLAAAACHGLRLPL